MAPEKNAGKASAVSKDSERCQGIFTDKTYLIIKKNKKVHEYSESAECIEI